MYRDELEAMAADGHLTRLDTAFSRDREHKVYVQDLMARNAQQLWAWLEEGALVYVCGDASRAWQRTWTKRCTRSFMP
ncbi:MAG: hypothetical protein ACRD3N_00135 [Terracidiphilus sp.]